jgi:hypothetical protein
MVQRAGVLGAVDIRGSVCPFFSAVKSFSPRHHLADDEDHKKIGSLHRMLEVESGKER